VAVGTVVFVVVKSLVAVEVVAVLCCMSGVSLVWLVGLNGSSELTDRVRWDFSCVVGLVRIHYSGITGRAG
jgi:hypothetical protein